MCNSLVCLGRLLTLGSEVDKLTNVLLDPTSDADLQVVSHICEGWVYAIVSSNDISLAVCFVHYASCKKFDIFCSLKKPFHGSGTWA